MNFDVSFCNSCSGKMIKVAFLVSQSSVVTKLMCGGIHDKGFIANIVLSPKIKNCENRSTIAKVMND